MKEKLVWTKSDSGTWILHFANASGGLAYLEFGLVWYVYSPTLGRAIVNIEAEDLKDAQDMSVAMTLRWLREVAEQIEREGPP